jgi:hypothetical protein
MLRGDSLKKSIFLALFFVFLVFGCIEGSKEFSNDGVVITSFDVIPEKVFKNDEFDIKLELENVGVYAATGHVYVYGPAWMDTMDEVFDLAPADPLNGIPGGRKTIIKTSISADANIPEKTTQDYTIYARACYSYESRYLATITSTSKNEFVITKEGISQESSQQIGAPISIRIESLPTYTQGDIILGFRLTNKGSGFPAEGTCTSSPEFEKVNKIESFYVTSDVGSVSCDDTHNIYLSNNEAHIRCKLTGVPIDAPKVQITLQAVASYTYYTTKSTVLTVIGGS